MCWLMPAPTAVTEEEEEGDEDGSTHLTGAEHVQV